MTIAVTSDGRIWPPPCREGAARASGSLKHGFTLVELLVVITIIGILIALLLPAVQAAREAARQLQCTNNLKQFGLAIHAFHDSQGRIPPTRRSCWYGTWINVLLPYIEQQPLADRWDPHKAYYQQPIENIQSQTSLYYCPSRRQAPQLSKSGDEFSFNPSAAPHHAGALSDYAVVVGDGTAWDYAAGRDIPGMPRANGAFVHAGPFDSMGVPDVWSCVGLHAGAPLFSHDELPLSFASIKDGLSNTIFLGEKHVPIDGRGQWKSSSGPAQYYCDNSIYNPDNLQTCGRHAGPGVGLARNPTEPLTQGWNGAANFGSCHPGICKFMLGDGSVTTFSVATDTVLLGRLAVRDDGQIVAGY